MPPSPSSQTAPVELVRAEFLEMPGLALTIPQAARLWHLDVSQSEHILGGLVESGLLLRDRKGAYRRRECPRCC